MSDRMFSAIKFTLLGSAVGTLSANAADSIYGALVPYIAPQGSSPVDNLGRAALAIVTSSATAALAVYGGEQILQYCGAEKDPFAGIFFYQICINQMSTAHITGRIVSGFVMQLRSSALMSTAPPPPSKDDEDIRSHKIMLQKPKSNCTISGCGALDLN